MFFKRLKNLWDISKYGISQTQRPTSSIKINQVIELKKDIEKKKGAIYLPKTDLEEAREARIAKNMAEGKDTLLSELE